MDKIQNVVYSEANEAKGVKAWEQYLVDFKSNDF
jgi:hypothetical protein